MNSCPVCGSQASINTTNPHTKMIKCPNCAVFGLTETAQNTMQNIADPNWSKKPQKWITENQVENGIVITNDILKRLF